LRRIGMIKGYILPRTGIRKLKNALDAYALRQRVTAENVANVQTPGYKSKKVTFEENLKKASARRLRLAPVPHPPRSIPVGLPAKPLARIAERKQDYSNGVNDVNIENEMVDIARTSLSYNLVTRLVRGRVENLKAAITGKHR
jgi:flagellar basal-body rod protein FlgB